MADESSDFKFELSTGILYAAPIRIDEVDNGEAPRNLLKLYELGRLLVLDTASIEPTQVEDEADLMPLSSLLTGKNSITASDYEHLDVNEWTITDYVDYGRWLDAVVTAPGQAKSRLTEHILERAYYLGLGCSLNMIKASSRFSSTGNFYQAMGITPGYDRQRYNLLSLTELADFVELVFLNQEERRSQGEPTLSLSREIERRASLGEGPSLNIFRGRGVRLGELLAHRGYVDARGMTRDDHVELGAKIMEANGGRELTREAIDFLSRSRRSTTSRTILSLFRWAEYLNQVKAAYEGRKLRAVKAKLPLLKQELRSGTLPQDAIRDAEIPEVLSRRARWLLVDSLLPDLGHAEKLIIIKQFSPATFRGVVKVRANLSDAEVEAAAETLGVAEDIWPQPPEYMNYLRVPVELMDKSTAAQ